MQPDFPFRTKQSKMAHENKQIKKKQKNLQKFKFNFFYLQTLFYSEESSAGIYKNTNYL